MDFLETMQSISNGGMVLVLVQAVLYAFEKYNLANKEVDIHC